MTLVISIRRNQKPKMISVERLKSDMYTTVLQGMKKHMYENLSIYTHECLN